MKKTFFLLLFLLIINAQEELKIKKYDFIKDEVINKILKKTDMEIDPDCIWKYKNNLYLLEFYEKFLIYNIKKNKIVCERQIKEIIKDGYLTGVNYHENSLFLHDGGDLALQYDSSSIKIVPNIFDNKSMKELFPTLNIINGKQYEQMYNYINYNNVYYRIMTLNDNVEDKEFVDAILQIVDRTNKIIENNKIRIPLNLCDWPISTGVALQNGNYIFLLAGKLNLKINLKDGTAREIFDVEEFAKNNKLGELKEIAEARGVNFKIIDNKIFFYLYTNKGLYTYEVTFN